MDNLDVIVVGSFANSMINWEFGHPESDIDFWYGSYEGFNFECADNKEVDAVDRMVTFYE